MVKIELRPWQMEDAKAFAVLMNNEKIQKNLRDGMPYPFTKEDGEQLLSALSTMEESGNIARAIVLDDILIGSILLTRCENIHRRTAELGYFIGEPYWGNGYATKAVELMCERTFADTDILRIFAEPFADNSASCRVLEKAGFICAHTLYQNAVKNGCIINMKLYDRLSNKVTPSCMDLSAYLECNDWIDYQNPSITVLADELMEKAGNKLAYIEAAFTFVRDQIAHSADAGELAITKTASEVLAAKHGICFAKSHLLTALLRVKGIPAGLCYQKLILSEEQPEVLIYHGLCGVYLEEEKRWIRLDARGNKEGVDAQFSTTKEQLAFPIRRELGEEDIFLVYPSPDHEVIRVLTENASRVELWKNLPIHLAYRNEK